MGNFAVSGPQQLSDFITPLTLDNATEMFDFMGTEESVYAAVYGAGNDGKPGKWAVRLTRVDGFIMCNLGDYHPRSEGKAEIIFK